jgi:hypothetical protein
VSVWVRNRLRSNRQVAFRKKSLLHLQGKFVCTVRNRFGSNRQVARKSATDPWEGKRKRNSNVTKTAVARKRAVFCSSFNLSRTGPHSSPFRGSESPPSLQPNHITGLIPHPAHFNPEDVGICSSKTSVTI